jgi:hypothetical protein
MNTNKQLLPRTILAGSLGLAAMLLFSTPSCKAQEVNPDHFTDTGVQDVYDAAQAQAPTPAVKHTLSATQARTPQTKVSLTMQPVAKRNAVLSAQLAAPAVDDKRKPATSALPKQ